MHPVRRAIRKQIHGLVGSRGSDAGLGQPRTDDGLFGPGSAAWAVHGDFTAMMIGGVSSLLVQMLHPAALAGVWDHSNFRHDMQGRLQRTARFIAGTTYGSTEQATALIDRVARIHDRVHGVMPDGRSYSANDPALLTWVHVAEVDSFLRAYVRYRDPGFGIAREERYFAETAIVAERLGARDVPKTRRDVDAYLRETRPQLCFDERTREVANALLSEPSPNPMMAPLRSVLLQAGVDLLPDWAAAMHRRQLPMPHKPFVRLGARGVGSILRWALRPDA